MITKKTYNLKELRKDRGLTLQELAEQVGIAMPTMQAIENGRGKGFNPKFKIALSDFYGIPLRHLFPEIQEEIKRLQELLKYKPIPPDDLGTKMQKERKAEVLKEAKAERRELRKGLSDDLGTKMQKERKAEVLKEAKAERRTK